MRILTELKSIPVNEYEKNKNLYQHLVDLHPSNDKYKNKVNFYSQKLAVPVVSNNLITLDYTWRKGAFDSIMEATFIIRNKSTHDIKDIQILCTHFANSGTKIDSNKRTIFEVIKANSKETYSNFNMGFIHEQANSTSCKIKNFLLTN